MFTQIFVVEGKGGKNLGTREEKMDKEQMKRSNRKLIFTQIHKNGAISRTQLAELTGLTSMTIGRIADTLIQQGLVVEEEKNREGKSVGRRPRLLEVAADSILSLGIELDRDCIHVGVLNFKADVIVERRHSENLFALTPPQVAKLAAKLIRELQDEQGLQKEVRQKLENCQICGVVCPGLVDSKKGIIRFSSQLQWHNIEFAQLLKEATGIPEIVLDNEVKSRAQAEVLFGQGQAHKRVALLNFGSGVGSSLVVDRKLYRGRGNLAGEIGHICLDPNGSICECGKRGCLQTYISDLSILQDARKFDAQSTLDSLFRAYAENEVWAKNIINHTVKYAVIAIGMLSNLYAPDIVILCGRLIERYPILQAAIQKEHINQTGGYDSNKMILTTSQLGETGNLIGAGTLAFSHELEKNVWDG